MNRRMFMKASMACAAVSGMAGFSSLFARAAWADTDIADGSAKQFDFDVLKKMAADLAKNAWAGAPAPLPNTLATLTPQAYNEIQYDASHSLWNSSADRELDVQFFHVGMGFKRRLRMFAVDEHRQAREIHFRPELFNYNNAKVDTKQLETKLIWASPVFAPLKSLSWPAEILFLSSAPVISVPWMRPINMVSLPVAWR